MINILFTGDYYPFSKEITSINQRYETSSQVFGDLKPLLDECNICALNVEFPITECNFKQVKIGPNLKGNVDSIKPLIGSGFNLAYLSNNHTMDYGSKGLEDTVSNLKKIDIETFGYGKNLEEARKAFIFEKYDIKISILNFSENEFNAASQNSPGANPLNIIDNVNDIKEAKKLSKYVFVVIHAGQDFNHFPPPFLKKQLRFYAENGATAIFCHHSHYISGYENYEGVPIFYGLGNLLYPKDGDLERNKTLVVKVSLTKDKMSYEVYNFLYSTKEMRLINTKIRKEYDYSNQVKQLSNIILNDKELSEHWYSRLEEEEKYRYLTLIFGYPHILFKAFKKLKILNFLDYLFTNNNARVTTTLNLLRREVHKNSIQVILEKLYDQKNNK